MSHILVEHCAYHIAQNLWIFQDSHHLWWCYDTLKHLWHHISMPQHIGTYQNDTITLAVHEDHNGIFQPNAKQHH